MRICQTVLRRTAAFLACLGLCLALLLVCAMPAAAAVDISTLAPYAQEGDYDYIRRYDVTVDLRADGSADITYAIDWQVVAGKPTEYLSWVNIGLANSHADELTILTPDTIAELQYNSTGGSYAKVVFKKRYYEPNYAAETGGESSVKFAFSVHQSHLFTINDDGTANFSFTPGWFDELVVEQLNIRWKTSEGFTSDSTETDPDGYLVWQFGPLQHGEFANVHVTVPMTSASAYDPNQAMTTQDYIGVTGAEDDDDDDVVYLVLLVVAILMVAGLLFLAEARRAPGWGGGFGAGIDPLDWYWYSNGVHTVRRARHAPPPTGYHKVDPPPSAFQAGGGSTRGGGVGRNGGDHNGHSGCACVSSCACAASCACACACAGGGRAGCTVKDFYTIKIKAKTAALPENSPENNQDKG